MKFTFSHRIIVSFLAIAILLILVGYLSSLTTKNLQKVSRAIMKENVSSLKAAEELELALLNQKGMVSSYFLDGNISWLQSLEERKKDFEVWFNNAQGVALTDGEKKILQDIMDLYKVYDNQRNRAIRLYNMGNTAEAKRILLNDMKNSVESLYQRCEELILANEALIAKAEVSSRKESTAMTNLIWGMIIAVLCLGIFMGFLIARRINYRLIYSAKMASLGQLSANIAHEIRNPLTSIKMRLYSLEKALKDDIDTKEDISVISEEINRMENTVRDFLDFARPAQPNLRKCDINQILEGTINLISPKANSQNIKLQKNFDAALAEPRVDKEQIRQAFLNIVLNSIEAMPDGGILEITTEKSNDKRLNSVLEIKIKDTGVGMSPDVKRRLFEPFLTTKSEGAGLGLFIASRIIQMHRGTIEVESQVGKGTGMSVKLPLAGDDSDDE